MMSLGTCVNICRAIALPLLLGLILFLFYASIGSAEAQSPLADVELIMDEEVYHADVRPNGDSLGYVSITGIIRVNYQPEPEIWVGLTVDAKGWGATAFQYVFRIHEDNEQDFHVVVIAPIGTPVGMRSIEIGGIWMGRLFSGNFPGETTYIQVDQYHDLLVSTPPSWRLDAGSSGVVPFTVQNRGNGDEIVMIDIQNIDELAGDGWMVEKPADFLLSSKSGVTVELKVRASDSASGSVVDLTVAPRGVRGEEHVRNASIGLTSDKQFSWEDLQTPFMIAGGAIAVLALFIHFRGRR